MNSYLKNILIAIVACVVHIIISYYAYGYMKMAIVAIVLGEVLELILWFMLSLCMKVSKSKERVIYNSILLSVAVSLSILIIDAVFAMRFNIEESIGALLAVIAFGIVNYLLVKEYHRDFLRVLSVLSTPLVVIWFIVWKFM